MLALTKCFQEIGLIDLFACIVLVPPSTKTGVQVAIALAALHNLDFEGRATVGHGDFGAGQFVRKTNSSILKLNDFNEAHLITKNITHPSQNCDFRVAFVGGKVRSPEEYNREPCTEKVRVDGRQCDFDCLWLTCGFFRHVDGRVLSRQHFVHVAHQAFSVVKNR